MKKILFIDTNIFIQCSFLEIEDGDTISSLEKVLDLLVGWMSLLLPEVTELETHSRLIAKERDFIKSIDLLKDKSKQYDWLGKHVTKDVNDAISLVLKQRLENYEKVKTTINSIFNHHNVIKVPLKHEHITEAYKFYIMKKKPFIDELKQPIQSDCLNLIAIKEALDKECSGYEFYFCSRDGDFYNTPQNQASVKGGVTKIDVWDLHTDITNLIQIKWYHRNLLQLLNDKFWVTFNSEEISEFDRWPFLEQSISPMDSWFWMATWNLVGETNNNSSTVIS